MTLGKKLQDLRTKKQLSQPEIAELLNVSQSAYHKWESDKSKPSIENLLKLCEFHDVGIDELLENVANLITNNNLTNSFINSSNINFNSIDLIKTILENQNNITKLIEIQNELIKKVVK